MLIPIGIQCTSATFKKELEDTPTLPFDWMFSTPAFVLEMLELLLQKNMNVVDLVKNHFFLCDKRANMTGAENYYTSENGFALYNTKYNVIFPHDKNNIETIDKYIRRFERLKATILHSNEFLCFIYTSPSSSQKGNFTIDGKKAIHDAYEHLSKIQKLIGTFRKNYKIIVFDTIQEEDIELLDEHIMLVRMNKCNHWNELLSQMKKYGSLLKS